MFRVSVLTAVKGVGGRPVEFRRVGFLTAAKRVGGV